MEQGFSVLMFIFAGLILLYAALMAITSTGRNFLSTKNFFTPPT